MKKEWVDLETPWWIPDSKALDGIDEVPLPDLAVEIVRDQIRIAGPQRWLFPNVENPTGHQRTLKTAWHAACAGRLRLRAGGLADEWVTQLLR